MFTLSSGIGVADREGRVNCKPRGWARLYRQRPLIQARAAPQFRHRLVDQFLFRLAQQVVKRRAAARNGTRGQGSGTSPRAASAERRTGHADQ